MGFVLQDLSLSSRELVLDKALILARPQLLAKLPGDCALRSVMGGGALQLRCLCLLRGMDASPVGHPELKYRGQSQA